MYPTSRLLLYEDEQCLHDSTTTRYRRHVCQCVHFLRTRATRWEVFPIIRPTRRQDVQVLRLGQPIRRIRIL